MVTANVRSDFYSPGIEWKSSTITNLDHTYSTMHLMIMLSTSGSCQRCVVLREGHIFCHEVFFRMYLPLALEMYNRLFILGFMAVDKILTLAISSHLTLRVQ